MRTFLKILAGCASAGLLLAGCSGQAEDPAPAPPAGTTPASALTANVAGSAAFAASGTADISAVRFTTTDPNDAPARLRIEAKGAGRTIVINLTKFGGAGTYVLKSDYDGTLVANNTATYYDGTSTYRTSYMPGSGTPQGQVVVSGYDATARRVRGTFSFSGSDVNPQNLPASHIRQLTDGSSPTAPSTCT